MKPVRIWPAALALFVLAPVCGELLSGSTPLRAFVNPFTFLYLSGLYGSGALIVREIVRRRGLGWRNVLLLGAAYGVLEEGLVVTSWTNPYWPDAVSLGAYGRFLDVNWVWALHLTLFHAVVSIAAPIVLAEAAFPRIANLPWLGDRAMRAVAIWLALISLIGLVGFGFLAFRDRGYDHPPASYAIALLIAGALVRLGLRLRSGPVPSDVPPPSLWRLRGFAFATTVAAFALAWIGPHVIPVALLVVVALGAVAAYALGRIGRWSARSGWGAEHRLALASGPLGFLIAIAPFVEFGLRSPEKDPAGQTLVGLSALVGLWLLARRPPHPAPLAVPA